MGYQVTVLSDEMSWVKENCRHMMIITGIHIHTTNERIQTINPDWWNLFDLAETLLVQYNTNNFLSTLKAELGPYPFKITRDRKLPNENAKITILDSTNTVFNYRIKLHKMILKGWIQAQRNFLQAIGTNNTPALLSMNDPEKTFGRKSHHGKIWKRTLHIPDWFSSVNWSAGVPGAYQLFGKFNFIGKNNWYINL